MATGDSANFLARLKSLLPRGWFGAVAPVRDALLGGLSDDLAATWQLLNAGRAAARLATTTGDLLDIVSFELFGTRLPRLASETDDAFRVRIVAEVFRERATRAGISKALVDLTGQKPTLFEPFNAADCGGGYSVGPAIGYGVAGAYGSLAYPNHIFVTAHRPVLLTIPGFAGYSTGGGYNVGGVGYADLQEVQGNVTDADIIAAVERVHAAGVIAWLAIEGGVSTAGGPDFFFFNG